MNAILATGLTALLIIGAEARQPAHDTSGFRCVVNVPAGIGMDAMGNLVHRSIAQPCQDTMLADAWREV